MAERWFYTVGGVRCGPVTSRELLDLARAGRIGPDDAVQKDGDDRSKPARKVRGLFPTAAPDTGGSPPLVATPNPSVPNAPAPGSATDRPARGLPVAARVGHSSLPSAPFPPPLDQPPRPPQVRSANAIGDPTGASLEADEPPGAKSAGPARNPLNRLADGALPKRWAIVGGAVLVSGSFLGCLLCAGIGQLGPGKLPSGAPGAPGGAAGPVAKDWFASGPTLTVEEFRTAAAPKKTYDAYGFLAKWEPRSKFFEQLGKPESVMDIPGSDTYLTYPCSDGVVRVRCHTRLYHEKDMIAIYGFEQAR